MKIKYFHLNELFIIGLGAIFNRVLNALNYREKYLPIKKEIFSLVNYNFKIIRYNSDLLISNYEKYPNQKFLIRLLTSDISVLKQVIIEKEYMPIVELVEKKYQKDYIKLIVDAGSNIGLATIFLNSYFPNTKIVAIEPEQSNFIQLKKNIEINCLNNNVVGLDKALWVNNTDYLNIGSEFRDGENWAKIVKLTDIMNESVNPITLKEIIDNYGKGQIIDILKMDIEGAEANLFKSSEFLETLAKYVRFFCFEIHEEFMSRESFHRILSDINFELSEVGETTFCFNKSLLSN
ncbi:MAG: FkbM family methyltransferase [Paludibacter sp.]|nr:FkbM family methyltransferase [Paludibacter sp.]